MCFVLVAISKFPVAHFVSAWSTITSYYLVMVFFMERPIVCIVSFEAF